MDATEAPEKPVVETAWSASEVAFLAFMLVVLVAVGGLGVLAYRQAIKTELTKRNGEQWAAWLAQEGPKRSLPGYEHPACATQVASEPKAASDTESTTSAKPSAEPSNNWGACLSYLSSQTELKDIRNPFTGQAPVFITACDPTDHGLVGSIAIEKVTPNPPGSAVATVASALVPSDSIAEKLHLKITVCDKGSYAVKIAELDF